MLVWYLVGQFHSAIFVKGPLTFFVLSALTIGFATVSWYLIEEPVSRLKKAFPVRSTRSQATLASQLA
jgi:peptidoglycan/LPS O-acetylase OafA/YrhL